VNAETKEQSKQWMHTHYPNKLKKLKQMPACQKANGICFLGQERSADGGSHATRDPSNIRSGLRNTKKLQRTMQKKKCKMLTSSVVLLHDNECPHTAAHTQALLEHFIWKLFGHLPFSPDLTLRNYHQFTYLNNWLGSQCINSNEELMEGVKLWLSSQTVEFFDTGIQKLILWYDKCLSSSSGYFEKYLNYVRVLCYVQLAENNRVQLIWVPGHECIVGNETANQLARIGSEHPFLGPEPACIISIGVAKKAVRDWTDRIHNWTQTGKGVYIRTLCQKNEGSVETKQRPTKMGGRITYWTLPP
jgi:hypothetical protein